jgi:23S rRNA pseudouridine2605 synthase
MQIRLQKIIADAGIASRRKAEELIRDGRVTVNGRTVRELGSKADPAKDHVKVNGRLIRTEAPKTHLILNKPRGVMTTLSDPQGRTTVRDFLPGVRTRVFPVGRLDYESEGLLFLTNDGDLAYRMMHPRHEIPRTYLVKVKGVLSDAELSRLRKGVTLPGGRAGSCRIEKLRKTAANSWVEVVLFEGQNRQVRRMMEKLGHTVLKLKRVRYASLELGDLPPGKYRYLSDAELAGLKAYLRRRENVVSARSQNLRGAKGRPA